MVARVALTCFNVFPIQTTNNNNAHNNLRFKLFFILHILIRPQLSKKVDDAIHLMNHHPLDGAIIGFAMTYPLDSALSNGQCYPLFEQLGPGPFKSNHVL